MTYPVVLVGGPLTFTAVYAFMLHLTGHEIGFSVLISVGIYEVVNPLTTLCVILPYRRSITRLARRIVCCLRDPNANTTSAVITIASHREAVKK